MTINQEFLYGKLFTCHECRLQEEALCEEYRLAGQDDLISAGYAIMGFFVFFTVIALACIIITAKGKVS